MKSSVEIISENIKQKDKVSLVNLGCARNLVDSQIILGELKQKGHLITELEKSDVAILNTCAFIDDAKKESIDSILELIDLKREGKIKKIVVAGCLSQRYREIIEKEFSEVDVVVGVLDLERAGVPPQISLTSRHFSYVKICESCYNKCSFCIIPDIKGKFKSRTIKSVVDEVRKLDARKVKEINIIGQDITAYGIDIYQKKFLSKLLKEIVDSTDNIKWIRLLYLYPAHITDDLIDVIASLDKICKYIDIPIQHISDKMLERMNRNITKKETVDLIKKIRKRIPRIRLRTSFIVGFPGETEKDFRELVDFLKAVKFEKVGVFKYSHEEGTPAFDMPGQISANIKEKRFKTLMSVQQEVLKDIQQDFIGEIISVLIEERHPQDKSVYVSRSEYDAPEVDGVVYVHSNRRLKQGDFVDVKITDSYEYDLLGDLV